MNPLARALTLSLLLLGVFLSAAFGLQWWLQRESQRVQAEALAAKRIQLAHAVSLLPAPAGGRSDEAYTRDLGTLLDGKASLQPGAASAPTAGQLTVDAALPGRPGTVVRLAFAPPAGNRLLLLHRQAVAVTLLLALLLLLVPLLLALPRRASPEAGTQTPWQQTRSVMGELTHFARVSVERGAELERESGARRRAEQDLEVSRTMLGQSHEQRAQLGRELHDNICQTLYAVSLTLDSVRKRLEGPPELAQRLELCQTELRRLNQQVRSYLQELEPGEIASGSFSDALDQMLEVVAETQDVTIERQFADGTLSLIGPAQAIEVVSILREAISNAVRHGGARRITLRAGRGDGSVALAVQDDGAGFESGAARTREGHGLANMQARATALGGSCRIESSPGKGARVLLLLPVASTT